MKTILVDDEIWMLRQFEDECANMNEIELVGKFQNADSALKYASENQVDLAFLDIEMPGMTGLELASELRKIYEEMIIIFVSAYEEYMGDAFRSRNADYYVLKPYRREDIMAAIEQAKLLSKRLRKKVSIHTFGKFDIYIDNQPVQFASSKAKELLAVLVDHQGGVVDAEEAFSLMWEEKSYDHTQASAYRRALQKLQSTLKENDAEEILVYLPRGRAINVDKVDCDLYNFIDGDIKAIQEFSGQYMTGYSWGEFTLPMLKKQKEQYDPGNKAVAKSTHSDIIF